MRPIPDPHPAPRESCWTCHRSRATCLCETIEPFRTGPRFVILQHPKERRGRTGTGRLTHLCLEESLLFEGVDFTAHRRLNALLADPAYQPLVLYPGKQATDISTLDGPPDWLDPDRRPLVLAIDGTWATARTMMKQSTSLHALPRITFSAPTRSQFKIKRQPDPVCQSTLEAIHHLLGAMDRAGWAGLEPPNAHDRLPALLARMVQFQIDCMNDPTRKGYRRGVGSGHDGQKRVKRWDKRPLFFEG